MFACQHIHIKQVLIVGMWIYHWRKAWIVAVWDIILLRNRLGILGNGVTRVFVGTHDIKNYDQ